MVVVHFLEIIAALGAVQAVLLIILISVRFHSRNLPLALLVLIFAVRVGTIPSWNPATMDSAAWIFPVAGSVPLLFGPVIWWYVRVLILHTLRPPKYFVVHLLPWCVELLLLSLLVYVVQARSVFSLSTVLFADPPQWWMPGRHIFKMLHGGAYAWFSARIAFGSASREKSITIATRIWARVTVLLPLLCMLSFSVIAIQPSAPAAGEHAVRWYYLPAAMMTLTIYAFAFLNMLFPEILEQSMRPVFRRATVPDREDVVEILRRLNTQLSSACYQDPELTLAKMARAIHVHPNRLSYAINQEYGMTFPRLVNGYRLEYFLQQVRQGGLEHCSILRLAMDSGFRSKSTFNRVFHEHYRMSPTDYLRSENLSEC